MSAKGDEPSGIERVRRAIARDGGYEWCDEHRTYRWWGPASCARAHVTEPLAHCSLHTRYFAYCPECDEATDAQAGLR